MKRNVHLVRKILLATERADEAIAFDNIMQLAKAINEEDYGPLYFHVDILVESGYIKLIGPNEKVLDYNKYMIYHLTSKGCDLLDSIRDDSIWAQIINELDKVGGSASLEIVKAIADRIICFQLGIWPLPLKAHQKLY